MSIQPIFFANIKNAALKLNNASGTAAQLLVAGSALGLRVRSLIVSSDDTSARTLQIIKTVSAVDYIIGEKVIAAGAGTDGATPNVDLLDSSGTPAIMGLQTDGVKNFIDVPNGTSLKVKAKTAVTAAKAIDVIAEYAEV